MFEIHNADCIEWMQSADPEQFDLSVFSPPFPALYAYTDSERDLGNVATFEAESKLHFGFFFRALRRVMKPGRVVVVHCMQIPRMKRSGGVGLCDFRGTLIRIAERAGLVWEYEWIIRKNPQAQAIRTRSRELQFAGLESDRAASRGALCDHLLKFRVPGDNAKPINELGQVSREQWIRWAEACWDDINETNTLNTAAAKEQSDTRHICPLQLEVIRRLVLLFSDPGETVFSPFAGIGSEGVVSVNNGRHFVGCELKEAYFNAAQRNLARADAERMEQSLMFAM